MYWNKGINDNITHITKAKKWKLPLSLARALGPNALFSLPSSVNTYSEFVLYHSM